MGFIIFLGLYIIIHTPSNFIFSISHFHSQIAATQFYCSHTTPFSSSSNLHERKTPKNGFPFSSPPSLHFPPHPQILYFNPKTKTQFPIILTRNKTPSPKLKLKNGVVKAGNSLKPI
jgi:hypothetical protein